MNDRTIRRVYAFFFAICALIGVAAVVALRNISAAAETADWVNHTHATIYALDEVVTRLGAGDGAARAFVWTGESRELAEARGQFSEMADNLESLKALTRADPALPATVAEIDALAEQHAAAALALAAAREGKDQAELDKLLRTDPGIETLREIKRRVAKVRSGQFELLDQRDHAAYVQAQTTRWVVGTCIALDLLLLGAVAWLIRDDLRARQRAADVMREANEQLETRVRERTAELSTANAELKTQALEDRWARQALEHQLHYNHLIINSVTELAIVVTRTLAISRINPAVEELSGRDLSEMADRPLGEFVSLTGAAADGDPLTQAMKHGRDLRNQPATFTDKAGRRHAVELNFFPLRDGNKIVGGVVTLRILPAAAS